MVEPKMRIELTTYALQVRFDQILTEAVGEKNQSLSPFSQFWFKRNLVETSDSATHMLVDGMPSFLGGFPL